jgi:hypothetical protein
VQLSGRGLAQYEQGPGFNPHHLEKAKTNKTPKGQLFSSIPVSAKLCTFSEEPFEIHTSKSVWDGIFYYSAYYILLILPCDTE